MKFSKSENRDQIIFRDKLFLMSPKDHHGNLMVIIGQMFINMLCFWVEPAAWKDSHGLFITEVPGGAAWEVGALVTAQPSVCL